MKQKRNAIVNGKMFNAIITQYSCRTLFPAVDDNVNRQRSDPDPLDDIELIGIPALEDIPHDPQVLALLAALIDPLTCVGENAEPALTKALFLLTQSAEFSNKLRAAGSIVAFSGNLENVHFLHYILRHSKPKLFLLLPDNDDLPPNNSAANPRLQDFLAANLHFEGKENARKSWCNFRTVKQNIDWFVTWKTLFHNIRSAQKVRDRQNDEGEGIYGVWELTDTKAAIEMQWAEWKNADCSGWTIPSSFIGTFIRWYRERRRYGLAMKQIGTLVELSKSEIEQLVDDAEANTSIAPVVT